MQMEHSGPVERLVNGNRFAVLLLCMMGTAGVSAPSRVVHVSEQGFSRQDGIRGRAPAGTEIPQLVKPFVVASVC